MTGRMAFLNARLIDPEAEDEVRGHLLVENGRIAGIETGSAPTGDCAVFDCGGKYLAPGIVDIGVKVSEPGERHKESFRSAGRAAAAGGVTTMVTRPDTTPAIDTPETLEFVMRRANDAAAVRVLPMAALTKGRAGPRDGRDRRSCMDAGAVAFTDCDAVVENTKVFSRCLTYAGASARWSSAIRRTRACRAGAAATSGQVRLAARACRPCRPMAERMGARPRPRPRRDDGRALPRRPDHHGARPAAGSSAPSDKGLDMTAGVSIHHLTLNEFDVGDYRTFFKVKPPLRSEDDRLAVVEAVADGLIDVDLLDAHAAGRGIEAPALRGGGLRRGGARDAAARGAAAVATRADLACRALSARCR